MQKHCTGTLRFLLRRRPATGIVFLTLTGFIPFLIMASKNDTPNGGDAAKMQEDNATGANQNQQGRASFTTGSTTGGGSNFGQGSSQLGGESYRQGSTANEGANYDNEAGRFSNDSMGFANESSASISAANEQNTKSPASGTSARDSDTPGSHREDRGQNGEGRMPPHEGDRRNTDLENASHLDTDNTTKERREQTGSWSGASGGEKEF
jgi:hypothetical protein